MLTTRAAGSDAPFVKSGVLAALIELLNDDSGPIRHLAVTALSTMRDADAHKLLLEASAFEKILNVLRFKHDAALASALLLLARLVKNGWFSLFLLFRLSFQLWI
jgi:hypothetical protein